MNTRQPSPEYIDQLRVRAKTAIEGLRNMFSMTHENYPIFAEEVKREHRTNQGMIFRGATAAIIALAENADEDSMDPRNEAACLMAQKLRDFMVKEGMPIYKGTLQVPFI